MPSIGDVFNEMKEVNQNLQQLHLDLGQLSTSLDGVRTDLQGITQLDLYADQALAHLSKQAETIICILEKVSEQTCGILNETHEQTGLEDATSRATSALGEMYRSSHPEAALEQDRLNRLRAELLACCPPDEPEPVCTYEPCEQPPQIGEPPEAERPVG